MQHSQEVRSLKDELFIRRAEISKHVKDQKKFLQSIKTLEKENEKLQKQHKDTETLQQELRKRLKEEIFKNTKTRKKYLQNSRIKIHLVGG
eukprot:TRINITY_DN3050_c0_g1_i2.p1 TRINITY_DN3050_c0_g1~~TRINITY_DN3050_c0_g1_i2.p1  ORF type:complete len:91 (+),score=11.59 TRINITY_DN3050_c0_g1_i2:348-620(+)